MTKGFFITINSQQYSVSEAVFKTYRREADRIRKKEQYHGRCSCPVSKLLACDGACAGCRFHIIGDMIPIDSPDEKVDGIQIEETLVSPLPDIEEEFVRREYVDSLLALFRQLDPDADTIIAMRLSGCSEREIARHLHRSQSTFADQMKQIRKELHKYSVQMGYEPPVSYEDTPRVPSRKRGNRK